MRPASPDHRDRRRAGHPGPPGAGHLPARVRVPPVRGRGRRAREDARHPARPDRVRHRDAGHGRPDVPEAGPPLARPGRRALHLPVGHAGRRAGGGLAGDRRRRLHRQAVPRRPPDGEDPRHAAHGRAAPARRALRRRHVGGHAAAAEVLRGQPPDGAAHRVDRHLPPLGRLPGRRDDEGGMDPAGDQDPLDALLATDTGAYRIEQRPLDPAAIREAAAPSAPPPRGRARGGRGARRRHPDPGRLPRPRARAGRGDLDRDRGPQPPELRGHHGRDARRTDPAQDRERLAAPAEPARGHGARPRADRAPARPRGRRAVRPGGARAGGAARARRWTRRSSPGPSRSWPSRRATTWAPS